VNLVFADVVWTEAVRRTAEVLRKILHRMDVGTNRVLRVVATLEFIQHQLSEMGHTDLLVTQTLRGQQCWGRPRGSVRRASGLVRTRLGPRMNTNSSDEPHAPWSDECMQLRPARVQRRDHEWCHAAHRVERVWIHATREQLV
jgi:hypothetical protein